MKKPLFIIIFFLSTITSLSIIQVALSNRLSTTGIEFESLQSKIEKYKKENALIEEKVLEASALINIAKEAKVLGFVETKSQIYLSNPLPLASNQ